jgi:hypothetical protein
VTVGKEFAMYPIADMNRAWAAWFELATVPFWFPQLVCTGVGFAVMEVAATRITKRVNEELNRLHR